MKFDPDRAEKYPHDVVYGKLEKLYGKSWEHSLGDGKASERIASDLFERLNNGNFGRHKPSDYHLGISRSYRDDGLRDLKRVKR